MAFLINPEVVAKNIKHYRRLQNYTTKQVADRSLLPLNLVEQMEGGLITPTTDQIRRVASVLAVRDQQLMMPEPPAREYHESC